MVRPNQIGNNLTKIIKTNVELVATENERNDINEEIKGFDTDEIMRKREKQQHWSKLLTKIEFDIEKKIKAKEENVQKQARISQLIAKRGGVQSSISNQRVDRLQKLKMIFEEGINELRLKLKDDVQSHATKAFKQITTEKTYSGLQINQSYGLSILDEVGEKLMSAVLAQNRSWLCH